MAGELTRYPQPTPNWRGLVHDLWFCLKQPPSHFEILLTGQYYAIHRRPSFTFIRFAFTREP